MTAFLRRLKRSTSSSTSEKRLSPSAATHLLCPGRDGKRSSRSSASTHSGSRCRGRGSAAAAPSAQQRLLDARPRFRSRELTSPRSRALRASQPKWRTSLPVSWQGLALNRQYAPRSRCKLTLPAASKTGWPARRLARGSLRISEALQSAFEKAVPGSSPSTGARLPSKSLSHSPTSGSLSAPSSPTVARNAFEVRAVDTAESAAEDSASESATPWRSRPTACTVSEEDCVSAAARSGAGPSPDDSASETARPVSAPSAASFAAPSPGDSKMATAAALRRTWDPGARKGGRGPAAPLWASGRLRRFATARDGEGGWQL
mmetsp:Transcript_96609/g.288432  ORF Transcript_96609/g.288432 Transcript_96609/m.288432 type:complete len:318 (+) Transcript_96609:1536-2489(+)